MRGQTNTSTNLWPLVRAAGPTRAKLFVLMVMVALAAYGEHPARAAHNDAFAAAEDISTTNTVTHTNVGATKEGGEPDHAGNTGGASIWYRWTAPGSGTYAFDTCGSDFNTVLAVYTGTDVSTVTPVASNDDTAVCGSGENSRVVFDATAGVTYFIAIDGFSIQILPETGSTVLNWSGQGTPAVTTQASPGVPLGGEISDTATLSNGINPTGMITFTLFGAACGDNPTFFTSTVPVNGNGTYTSGAFTPTSPGTYNWVAEYSGDVNNSPASTNPCDDPLERVVVQATPFIVTQASPTVPLGGQVNDTATLSGGFNPTGTITFSLYGPNDPNCSAVPVFTSTVPVAGNGTFVSGSFVPTTAGIYRWVAVYSGDADNVPVSAACDDPNESVLVGQLTATLATQASTNSTSVSPGTTVSDTATLTPPAGAPAPTGTVTYALVGPNPDVACAGPVAGSSTVPVGFPSGLLSVTAPGTYNFVATYSGDANYGPITTPVGCGDPAERFTVALQSLTLTTQASTNATNVAPGTTVSDTATLTTPVGGPPPSGTVTYTLIGPNPGAGCTAPVVGTSTVPLGAPSASFTVPSPGTYNFVATYSGDAFYAPISAPVGCGDPAERFTVSPPVTTTTTSTTTTSTTTTLPPTTTTTSTTTTLPPTTTTTSTTTTLPPTTTTTTTITTTTSSTTTLPPTTSTTSTLPPTTTTSLPTTTTTTSTTTTLPTTTTTLPPAGTTTTLPAPVVPTTTVVPMTTAPTTTLAPTTTVMPTTTTPRPSTTLPPTPPTTVPIGPGPALNAINPDGQRDGPPGVGLAVSGDGYLGCRNVYFFFDGVRIGTTSPDANGFVDADDLSVPGDTDPGEHTLTSSCSTSGGPVRASSTFVVTDAEFHRAGVVTSLANPDQVSLELERLLASMAASGLVILLFAFPSKLFNGTVEENYDEIRAWFQRPARAVDSASTAARTAGVVVMNALAGIALGFLSPDFGLNMNSLVLAVAFTLSLSVMSAGWSLPAAIGIHRRTGEWGKLNFLPGTLLVSIVMVFICRRLEIQPGYFYGALAGLAFASALNKETQGRLVAANWTWALAVSLASWFLRLRVSEVAAEPDASVLWIGLEAFLVMTFLWGVETLAVAMLPMRFMDGPKVKAWNRWVWAALLFAGVFTTVHVLLVPTSGYVGQTETQVAADVVIVFLVFCAISVATWAYFRYRPARWIPRPAR